MTLARIRLRIETMKSLLLFAIAIVLFAGGWWCFRADALGMGVGAVALGLIVGVVGLVVNHAEHTRR